MSERIKTPCCACLGHVDVGKTSLLDYMRNSDTEEASGITQQIGTTLYNRMRLEKLTGDLKNKFTIDSLLIIDTPGHECFDLIRFVALKVSDVVILIIDIVKGLEKQTINIIQLLQKEKIPFIICLNKMDKIYGWKKVIEGEKLNISCVLKRLDQDTRNRYNDYVNRIKNKLYEHEVYSELYYENKKPEEFTSMVPCSAKTGEGVPDLIMLISCLAEKKYLKNILIDKNITHGYILDSHYDKSYGQYYISLHRNGSINKGDEIIINACKYRIKQILINPDNKEIKDDHRFMRIDTVDKSMGIGIIIETINGSTRVTNIEPSSTYSIGDTLSDVSQNDEQYNNYNNKWQNLYICKKGNPGIQVVAPSHIMMDGLLHMIKTEDIAPIERCKVGKIEKKDLIISSKWNHRSIDEYDKRQMMKYSVILSYDPSLEQVSDEILKEALVKNVKIIHSNVIYKLLKGYVDYVDELEKLNTNSENIVSASIKIIPKYIFRSSNPMIFGVVICEGTIKKNDKVYTDEGLNIYVGKIESIQLNNKDIDQGTKNQEMCIKISSKLTIGSDILIDKNLYCKNN